MLRWNQLTDSDLYVLDLIQHENGLRQLKLRRATDERHENTVFVSHAYSGEELKRWMRELTLSKNAKLENGSTFVEEAHGGWFTKEEFAFKTTPI